METYDISASSPPRNQVLPEWVAFVLRRLLFIAGVAFAIVYFYIFGLRLLINSATVGRPVSAWELAGPALEETVDFFNDALRGNLSYVVRDLLVETYLPSGRLLLTAIGMAAVLGVVAGGLAAAWRHSPLALPTLTLTVIGISIPSFFLALLLQVADIRFYQRTGVGLFPVYGISLRRTESLLPQVVAPALVLAARPLAHITRVTFVSLSEVLERDFIRTARAKGLGPTVVFWRHALRNAGIPILTAVVVSLRFGLGSLPVVELFFTWPGLGQAMLEAIYQGQVWMVAALGLSLGVTFLLITLLLDLVYRWIDPRLREVGEGSGP
ncbi:MAG TPA: ABC transporter permease [Anaerolineales bacterium]|nr:ABC transporter permease [Anaerolineae bacterium]HIQ01254.1 ABC transporter permease [Anaerolineales bacterium]